MEYSVLGIQVAVGGSPKSRAENYSSVLEIWIGHVEKTHVRNTKLMIARLC
jgi:hypothetical protein